MATKNEKNFDKYKANLKKFGHDNLPMPDHKETIPELLAEGNRLLKEEEKAKKSTTKKLQVEDTKPLDTALGLKSPNPYIRARTQILQKWMKDPKLQWKAKEVERMENGTNPKDQFYNEFVILVEELGDKLSDEKV